MGFIKDLFSRPPKPGKVLPVTDETFEPEVLASDLPSAVDFWSPKCPPCQVMGGLINELGPEYTGRVNIFKLNVEQNGQTAMQYQVRSVPTLILFRNGREIDRVVGLMPLNQLKQKLDSLIS